jgi:4'-phosphopantetheinyl transferase
MVPARAQTSQKFARIDPANDRHRDGTIAIGTSEIHVWTYSIGEADAVVDMWAQLLSADEMQRADRFVRTEDRCRWIVAHGVLRHLLARYCGIAPRALTFEHGVAGKPFLTRPGGVREPIGFNLAHSHGRALLGVARGRDIGVDLEWARDDFDPLPLARQYFFGSELKAILDAEMELQRDAFFRHWVAKEAVLKAQGVGLSFPLDGFAVAFDAQQATARVRTRDPSRLASDWFVRALSWDAGWHGAVAALGEDWNLRLMQAE